MQEQTQNETTFYQDGYVAVTRSRYITQSKTYAMRNISSVHIFEIEKSKAPIHSFGDTFSSFRDGLLDGINTYYFRNTNVFLY
jgi:hypothetical protein